MDSEPKQKRGSPLVLVLILIIVLLAVAAVVLVMSRPQEALPEAPSDGNAGVIGYEEGVTAVDGDTLQEAVDRMYEQAAEEGIPIEFQNDGSSPDGQKVNCYIANPEGAPYDFYIQIFSDSGFTDQLYLSKLIPPGKALRELNLEKRLDVGKHRVYVVFTQVEDDHATAHQQASVTMDFTVKE